MTEYFDFIGQKLEVGDFVTIGETNGSTLLLCWVVKLTPKQVTMRYFDPETKTIRDDCGAAVRSYDRVVKVSPPFQVK